MIIYKYILQNKWIRNIIIYGRIDKLNNKIQESKITTNFIYTFNGISIKDLYNL